jgi:hypothetical protein
MSRLNCVASVSFISLLDSKFILYIGKFQGHLGSFGKTLPIGTPFQPKLSLPVGRQGYPQNFLIKNKQLF